MRLSLASALALGALAVPAFGQASDYTTELVANGYSRPVELTSAPGVSDRLFVVEQNQADIHLIDLNTNTKIAAPFLDLTGKVATGGNEQGLLGLAFHPDYQNNGFFYVNYTASSGGATRIERYQVSANPDVANAASGFTILQISQPQSNHNGGELMFGPDGMLWIPTGDGGNANDTGSGHASGGNAQSGATLLGKMLRIDVDGGSPYAIPGDNPYKNDPAVEDEIWAFGLRNPFRCTFDRDTGDLWIGDVGQNAREELDFVSAEEIAEVAAGTHLPFNFGWRCKEGFLCTGLTGCDCADTDLEAPIVAYGHGQGFSIIELETYRGVAIPDLYGTHFFADHYTDFIRAMTEDGTFISSGPTDVQGQLDPPGALNLDSIAGAGLGPDGEMYLADLGGGEVFKIVPAGPFLGLGAALAGTTGDPVHFGTGGVAPGVAGALHLRNGAPGAISGLFLGTAEGNLPFKGGTLVASPFFALFVLNTNGSGEIDIPWATTGTIPSGAVMISQFAVQDAGAPVGISLSNALRTVWP